MSAQKDRASDTVGQIAHTCTGNMPCTRIKEYFNGTYVIALIAVDRCIKFGNTKALIP